MVKEYTFCCVDLSAVSTSVQVCKPVRYMCTVKYNNNQNDRRTRYCTHAVKVEYKQQFNVTVTANISVRGYCEQWGNDDSTIFKSTVTEYTRLQYTLTEH